MISLPKQDVFSDCVAKTGAAAPNNALASRAKGLPELVEIVYREYSARRDAGEIIDAKAFCEQFPDLKDSLTRLIDAHCFLEQHPELLGEVPDQTWPEAGQSLLGFQLQHELGRGTFARVFLATEPALGNRRVAVKFSHGGGAEANTLGRINHPNIVPVNHVKEDGARGLTAVCMPYLGSATLGTVLDHMHALPAVPRRAWTIAAAIVDRFPCDNPEAPSCELSGNYVDCVCRIGAELADALQFIHQRDICHRDLKPSNVLMTPSGRPMLLDFNLCADPQMTDGRLGGTLPYMPPEQLQVLGRSPAAAPAVLGDLYALGVILYELLTGRHPFGPLPLQVPAGEARLLLMTAQRAGPISARQLNPEVDAGLSRLVERCLAHHPKDRPQSAAEVASALRRRQTLLQRARRHVVRHRWVAATAAVLVLGLAGAAAAFLPESEAAAIRQWRSGQLAAQAGDFDQAVRQFSQILDEEPDRADVWLAKARAYQEWGDASGDKAHFASAIDSYHTAQRLRPDPHNWASIGYCLLRTEQRGVPAQHFLKKAIDEGVGTAEVFNNLGFSWMNAAKKDQALLCLEEALKLNPKLQAAYHNRAVFHFIQVVSGGMWPPPKPPLTKIQQKNYDKAKQTLKKAKADVMLAAEKGPLTGELAADAARIFSVSSAYEPTDFDRALQFLKDALAKEDVDPKSLKIDPTFADPPFQDAIAGCLAAKPVRQPLTRRIVDTLPF
jgi:serine/threonine protein kinase/Tfp pilus assembly protein PilF